MVSKAEPRAAAIGCRAKLVLVDQPGPPHLRCSFRCQIEAKVSILIHRDLALRQIDTMTPQQSLSPCKALIVHDAGKPLVPSAIGDAGRSAFRHVDLVAGSSRQRLVEAVAPSGLAWLDTCRFSTPGEPELRSAKRRVGTGEVST